MKKTRTALNWIMIGFLCTLGLVVYFFLPGFSFSGLILLGLAGLWLCFLLIRLLKSRHLQASKGLFTVWAVLLFWLSQGTQLSVSLPLTQ